MLEGVEGPEGAQRALQGAKDLEGVDRVLEGVKGLEGAPRALKGVKDLEELQTLLKEVRSAIGGANDPVVPRIPGDVHSLEDTCPEAPACRPDLDHLRAVAVYL